MKDTDIEKIAELVAQKLAFRPNWVYTPPQYPYYPYYPYPYHQWYGWSATNTAGGSIQA